MKKKSASTDKSKEKRKEKKKTKKLRIQRESVQLKIMKCLSREKEEEEGKNPIRTQICYNNIALKFAAICSFVRMYARFFSLCKMFKSQTD